MVPVVRTDEQSLREEALPDEVRGSAERCDHGSKTHGASRKKKEAETGRTVVESRLTEDVLIENADQFATVVGSVRR